MTKFWKVDPQGGTGNLVLGILLTVLGTGALIDQIWHKPVWDYIWKLWPALLIIMGVKILLNHYSFESLAPKDKS